MFQHCFMLRAIYFYYHTHKEEIRHTETTYTHKDNFWNKIDLPD